MFRDKLPRPLLILAVIALAVAIVILGKNFLWSHAMKAYDSPPEIRILNRSGVDLQGIVLEGRGFRESIGNLDTGARLRVDVMPAGESSLQIEFYAQGRHFIEDDLAYIEPKGGYWVELIILEDYSVDVDGGFRFFR